MFINIRLKSPLQSWGNQTTGHTSGAYHGTNEFPTYSGIVGLICACCGINRTRNYNKYIELVDSIKYVSAIASKQFSIVVDNQNMGGGYRKDIDYERKMVPLTTDRKDWVGMWNAGVSSAKLSSREYLENADFVVTIETDEDTGNFIVSHLKNPVWFPVFGRSCCIPSTRLYLSTFDSYDDCIMNAKNILNSDRLIAYMSEKPSGKYHTLDMYDVPVITQAFKYTRRKVYKIIL